jgi:hypothetical protein
LLPTRRFFVAGPRFFAAVPRFFAAVPRFFSSISESSVGRFVDRFVCRFVEVDRFVDVDRRLVPRSVFGYVAGPVAGPDGRATMIAPTSRSIVSDCITDGVSGEIGLWLIWYVGGVIGVVGVVVGRDFVVTEHIIIGTAAFLSRGSNFWTPS